jgi:hypothetical protein
MEDKMQSRSPLSQQQWEREEFDQPHMYQGQSHAQQALVSPLLQPDKALRRQVLVSELFKDVKEIRSLDNGYSFRFDRSDDLENLLRKIAEYIVFESLNSSQLTFMIDEEPKGNDFWLQVRSLWTEVSNLGPAYMSFYSSRLYVV